jgi:hypothetical protein
MNYPRASIHILDMNDGELAALQLAVEHELYRRDVQRRAVKLVEDDLRAKRAKQESVSKEARPSVAGEPMLGRVERSPQEAGRAPQRGGDSLSGSGGAATPGSAPLRH